MLTRFVNTMTGIKVGHVMDLKAQLIVSRIMEKLFI